MGILDPGKILDNAKKMIIKEFENSEDEVKDGMDISLCCIKRKNDDEVEIKYAGAHNSFIAD